MPKYEVISSNYLRFSIRENSLRIFITKEGREELREYRERLKTSPKAWQNDLDLLVGLMEHHLCNGWELVRPEQVGDLRDDAWMVISRDTMSCDENHDDELTVGVAYSYNQYALELYITPLLAKGYIDFEKHEYLTPQQFEYIAAERRPDKFDEGEREAILGEATAYYDRMCDVNEHKQAEWYGQLRLFA